jgi:hypothetical protein
VIYSPLSIVFLFVLVSASVGVDDDRRVVGTLDGIPRAFWGFGGVATRASKRGIWRTIADDGDEETLWMDGDETFTSL